MIYENVKAESSTVDYCTYGSISEMLVDYEKAKKETVGSGGVRKVFDEKHDPWFGDGPEKIKRDLITGDESGVVMSSKILEQIDGKIQFDSSAFRVENTITGGAPNIGAYLAGSPLSMRMRKRNFQDTNPAVVLLNCGVSADTDHDEIQRKGAAALSLVRLVGQARPITLKVCVGLQSGGNSKYGSIVGFDVNTQPLDLASASYMLTRPEVFRRIIFGIHHWRETKQSGSASSWIPWLNGYDWGRDKLTEWVADFDGYKEYLAVGGTIGGFDGEKRKDVNSTAEWVVENAKRLLRPVGDVYEMF